MNGPNIRARLVCRRVEAMFGGMSWWQYKLKPRGDGQKRKFLKLMHREKVLTSMSPKKLHLTPAIMKLILKLLYQPLEKTCRSVFLKQ